MKEHLFKKSVSKRTLSLVLSLILLALSISSNFSLFPEQKASATNSKAIVIIPGIGGTSLANSSEEIVWFSTLSLYLIQMQCSTNGTSVNTLHPSSQNVPVLEIACVPLWTALHEEFSSEYDVLLFRYSSMSSPLSVTVSSNTTRTVSATDPNGNPVPYVESSEPELVEMNA